MTTRYEFFQKILSQLEDLQTTVNHIREAIKEEIQKGSCLDSDENVDRTEVKPRVLEFDKCDH